MKCALDNGYFFDFTPPSGEALVSWVLKAAKKERLDLPMDAARTLCDLVGNDLLGLKSEIDKLALLQSRVGRMHDLIEGILQYSRVSWTKEDIDMV